MMRSVRSLALAAPVLLLSAFAGTDRTAPALSADTTVITIKSTAAGGLAFEPDLITVKAGTPVKIRFANESPFNHNIVIMKKEADIDDVGAASFDAHDTGFVPMQHKAKYVAWSPLAPAGKTVEFSFIAPPAGDYPYVCFVDGHFNMMVGKLKSVK